MKLKTIYSRGMKAVIYFLLLIFLGIIFIGGVMNWDKDGAVRAVLGWKMVPLSLAGSVTLLFIWSGLHGWLRRQNEKVARGLLGAAVIFAVLIQGVLIWRYPVQCGWDNIDTLTSAISLLSGDESLFSTGYFEAYAHQKCFLLVTYGIVRLGTGLGIGISYMPLVLSYFNMIAVDLAIWFVYLSAKELKNRESANSLLLLMLLNPGLYLWCAYYYTTSVSLLPLSLFIYLMIRMEKEEQKWYVYLGSGLLFMFGLRFRATICIALIAGLIVLTVRKADGKTIIRKGSILKGSLLFLAGVISMELLLHAAFVSVLGLEGDEKAFPFQHWLMMSAGDNGAYNDEDVYFTASLATKQERAEKSWERYCQRLEDMGIDGFLVLAKNKTVYNWSLGNHGYEPELQHYDGLSDILWGDDIRMIYLVQMYHLALVLMIILSIVKNIRGLLKGRTDVLLLPLLTLLGGILFYVLWETNPFYSVGFLYVMFLCSLDGMEILQMPQRTAFVSTALPALLLMATAYLLGSYVSVRESLPVMTQNKVSDILYFGKNKTISQTFTPARNFNTLELYLTKERRKEDSSGIYQISVVGQKQGIVFEETLYNQDVYRTIDYLKTFPEVKADGTEEFEVRIEVIQDDEKNRLGISYYNLPVDFYQKGSLYVDGEQAEGDLRMTVLRK